MTSFLANIHILTCSSLSFHIIIPKKLFILHKFNNYIINKVKIRTCFASLLFLLVKNYFDDTKYF